jgi:flotillin
MLNLFFIIPIVLLFLIVFWVLTLRRVVPPNVVHIVQRGSKTVSYGVGYGSNVYYKWPAFIPILGILVRELPVSNFDIDLVNYSAYDKDRVPFKVDVKSFFFIEDTNVAAQKVESFEELKNHLTNIVQGSVRSILAKSKLEDIMEERPKFGEAFTQSVLDDLKNWGVKAIKNIELMDVRDAENSNVIKQIMAKRMSAIETESRVEVAKNNKIAVQEELEANKEIDVKKAETQRISGEAQAQSQQAIEIAKAKSQQASGIAKQESISEIAKAEKETEVQKMEVLKVNEIRTAEIEKEKALIVAEKQKQQEIIKAQADGNRMEIHAAAELEAQKKKAEAIKTLGQSEAEIIIAKGTSEAESKKLMELARVTAEVTLAKEIGQNESYQSYLIEQSKVEVSKVVGVAQYESLAKALQNADLKLLVNSGDVQSGLGKLTDLFTSKGGSQITGLFEALSQTEEGSKLLSLLKLK